MSPVSPRPISLVIKVEGPGMKQCMFQSIEPIYFSLFRSLGRFQSRKQLVLTQREAEGSSCR